MSEETLIALMSIAFSAGWVFSSIYHTNKFNKYIERQESKIKSVFIED